MKFLLEPFPTPTPVGVAGRKTSHLTDHPEEAFVRFLCGARAEAETLVEPQEGMKPCQKCESAAAGDARVKRLIR